MDALMTQWAFRFGGWIGVIGGTFMVVTVPHNYTILLLLLSPWLGAISLYLLMFATFSWMNICVQVTAAMLKHEIVVALLTSIIGVLIVAIARQIIDMERGHRTTAQAAADESAATNTALPPSPVSEPDAAPGTAPSEDSDADTGSLDEHSANEDGEEEGEDEEDEDGEEEEDEDGEEEEGEDTSNDGDDEGGDEQSEESEKTDSDSSLNKARTDSSYENIQTPQLTAINRVSPIPTIPDM